MIKIRFHSIVDVITNSSTVIYTYQNSIKEAKELVAEMLKLMGIDKSPDDVFYYGVFCDNDAYFDAYENDELPEDCPKVTESWSGNKELRDNQIAIQSKWFEDYKLLIIKGDKEKCEWMLNSEKDQYGDSFDPDSYLNLIPKEEQYKVFGEKIKALLGSISADGGRDG